MAGVEGHLPYLGVHGNAARGPCVCGECWDGRCWIVGCIMGCQCVGHHVLTYNVLVYTVYTQVLVQRTEKRTVVTRVTEERDQLCLGGF